MNFGMFFSYMIPGIVIGMMIVFAVREALNERRRRAARTKRGRLPVGARLVSDHQLPINAASSHSVPPMNQQPKRKLYIHDLNGVA